jgi:GNAT superfamily N-acetyltransferase
VIDDEYRFIDRLADRHVEHLHALYQDEWWTRGRTLGEARRVVEGSDYVFGICQRSDDRLVAFARVLTDGVFKALIFDVIVAAPCRSGGLGRALMTRILQHPAIAQVRHLELYCRPELKSYYEQWGFSADLPEVNYMRRKTNALPPEGGSHRNEKEADLKGPPLESP